MLDHFSEIIKEASKSPLAYLSLISLLLEWIVLRFFTKSSEIIKMIVFILLFGSIVVFAYSIFSVNSHVNQRDRDNLFHGDKQAVTIVLGSDFARGTFSVDDKPVLADSVSGNQVIIFLSKGYHKIVVKEDGREFTRYINIPSGDPYFKTK